MMQQKLTLDENLPLSVEKTPASVFPVPEVWISWVGEDSCEFCNSLPESWTNNMRPKVDF